MEWGRPKRCSPAFLLLRHLYCPTELRKFVAYSHRIIADNMSAHTRILLLLLLLALGAQAQDKPFAFAVKVGPSLSNTCFVHNGNRIATQWAPSVFLGVGGHYAFSSLLGLEADVLLLTKGHRLYNVGVFTGQEHNDRFGSLHIDVPINLKVGLDLSPSLRAYAHVGPYVSVALQSIMWITEEYSDGSQHTRNVYPDALGFPIWHSLKRFDMGLNAGLGLLLKHHYQAGLVYYHGMLNQAKPAADKLKHRMLCLELGYWF